MGTGEGGGVEVVGAVAFAVYFELLGTAPDVECVARSGCVGQGDGLGVWLQNAPAVSGDADGHGPGAGFFGC